MPAQHRADLLITDAVGTRLTGEALIGARPVRCGGEVVAMLTHQTAGEGRRTSSPLEQAYSDCAATLLDMVSGGHFPQHRRRGGVPVEPAGG